MTRSELIAHARELRIELNAELPNGVGNTIDALIESLTRSNDTIEDEPTVVREAIIAEIQRQTEGRWPVERLVDAALDFDELARAAIKAMRAAITPE